MLLYIIALAAGASSSGGSLAPAAAQAVTATTAPAPAPQDIGKAKRKAKVACTVDATPQTGSHIVMDTCLTDQQRLDADYKAAVQAQQHLMVRHADAPGAPH